MFLLADRSDGSRNSPSAEEAKGGNNGSYQPAATAHAYKIH
jgi:hypothetical protein